MLQIRFLQTGAWNLGSPVIGLSNSPDWLRRTAASAVRQAVQNVFNRAVAERCSFVLVAGRLASRQNLPAAAAWLAQCVCQLRSHGISLVVTGHDVDEWPVLQALGAVILKPNSGLTVPRGSAELICTATRQDQSLWIDCSGSPTMHLPEPHGVQPDASCSTTAPAVPPVGILRSGETVSAKGWLRPAVDSPQPIAPSKTNAGACALVTADFTRGEFTAQGFSPEVLQFVSVREECASGTTVPQLLRRLAERHRALSSSRVVRLVDWEIAGRLRFSLQDDASLRESDLLHVLRHLSNAGHSGSWPYRLQFSEDCVVEVCERSSRLMSGILSVAAAPGLVSGTGSSCLELLHQLQRAA